MKNVAVAPANKAVKSQVILGQQLVDRVEQQTNWLFKRRNFGWFKCCWTDALFYYCKSRYMWRKL